MNACAAAIQKAIGLIIATVHDLSPADARDACAYAAGIVIDEHLPNAEREAAVARAIERMGCIGRPAMN
jgi:hypothetical protein